MELCEYFTKFWLAFSLKLSKYNSQYKIFSAHRLFLDSGFNNITSETFTEHDEKKKDPAELSLITHVDIAYSF
jgi:hypothetical protein